MNRILLSRLFFALILFSLTANTLGESFTGKVMDWHTKKPIEGVIVVYEWEVCIGIADCNHFCENVESDYTDSHGKFYIYKIHRGRQMNYVYKQGYKRFFNERGVSPGGNKGIIYMERDTSAPNKRLDSLTNLTLSCSMDEDARGVLAPLYAGIYKEAKSIARSKEEIRKADFIYKYFEINDLDHDEADVRENIRNKPLMKIRQHERIDSHRSAITFIPINRE
jgi:hypothetical protein